MTTAIGNIRKIVCHIRCPLKIGLFIKYKLFQVNIQYCKLRFSRNSSWITYNRKYYARTFLTTPWRLYLIFFTVAGFRVTVGREEMYDNLFNSWDQSTIHLNDRFGGCFLRTEIKEMNLVVHKICDCSVNFCWFEQPERGFNGLWQELKIEIPNKLLDRLIHFTGFPPPTHFISGYDFAHRNCLDTNFTSRGVVLARKQLWGEQLTSWTGRVSKFRWYLLHFS
jgi:hypothetical protein